LLKGTTILSLINSALAHFLDELLVKIRKNPLAGLPVERVFKHANANIGSKAT
jgi:hypothetical protein